MHTEGLQHHAQAYLVGHVVVAHVRVVVLRIGRAADQGPRQDVDVVVGRVEVVPAAGLAGAGTAGGPVVVVRGRVVAVADDVAAAGVAEDVAHLLPHPAGIPASPT